MAELDLTPIVKLLRSKSQVETTMANSIKSIHLDLPEFEKAAVLQSSFLFRNIPINIIKKVESHLETVQYTKGDPIFLEQEKSDQVYFIVRGSVEIIKYRPMAGSMHRIVIFEAGECFSELSHYSVSAFDISNCPD
ncbi:MAG: cyclic nucleotide-binding domain-containing protein [Oligoflexus sp.]